MKKLLLIGIVVLTAEASTSYAQYISLDNYSSGSNLPLTFGDTVPLNGVSGALAYPGLPINSAWTVGLYYAVGSLSINDPAGPGNPAAPLTLATGIGSTITFGTENAVGSGYFGSIHSFNTGSSPNATVTLEIVVYPTAAGSYGLATYRAHSAPFTVPTVVATSPTPRDVGDYMPLFSVDFLEGSFAYVPVPTPEPATLALAGLGLGTLIMLRRLKDSSRAH
jgi:hypothetical protein